MWLKVATRFKSCEAGGLTGRTVGSSRFPWKTSQKERSYSQQILGSWCWWVVYDKVKVVLSLCMKNTGSGTVKKKIIIKEYFLLYSLLITHVIPWFGKWELHSCAWPIPCRVRFPWEMHNTQQSVSPKIRYSDKRWAELDFIQNCLCSSGETAVDLFIKKGQCQFKVGETGWRHRERHGGPCSFSQY